MKNRQPEDDWARQVPERRWRGPYRDYGWERGQSALPEFRDPSVHYMPYERAEIEPWQRDTPRTVMEPGDLDNGRGPHTGKGPRGYTRSDERIYEEVCNLMTRHGQLDARDISVQVHDGEVTLDGRVPDRWTKRLATDLSEAVFGVRDVHNRLEIDKPDETPARWRDEVGHSGVYPASAAWEAPSDAQVQGMASWGQGERGAEGYNDHGDSELHIEGKHEQQKKK